MVYVGSDREANGRKQACLRLGTNNLELNGRIARANGAYRQEESEKRADVARLFYAVLDNDTETALLKYEQEFVQIERRRKTLLAVKEGNCSICGKINFGKFDICPICLDVYHREFRANLKLSLDSCEALRIIDGV